MIPWLAAGFLVVAFVGLAGRFGLADRTKDVVSVTRESLRVMRDRGISDDQKERAVRRGAGRLFRLFFILTLGGAAAVFAPVGVLWLADRAGLISLAEVFAVAFSPAFLLAGGVLAAVVLWLASRGRHGYSPMDRLLHRVAFHTAGAQVALADLEDRLYRRRLARCRVDRPVFITALPRAGTTLLLEICAGSREFASHCYRDMPFVLIPCLWGGFSARFRRGGQRRQRAHGDGTLIDFDSPEALEEVVWKAFWHDHYRHDRLAPWPDETDDEEFAEFFRRHMRKIILLRRGTDAPAARYVSKNNLNIARAPMLRRLFPHAAIIVPFRRPLHHAASLLEQHRNFLRIHREDRFAAAYMRGIGHYDFGQNLRPVDFEGWLDARRSPEADALGFWLEYWIAAYRHLLGHRGLSLHFVSYESLCEDPARGLERLADAIGSDDRDALVSAAERIRPPRPREVDVSGVARGILEEADGLHAELRDAALH